jgi:hypothetical protein
MQLAAPLAASSGRPSAEYKSRKARYPSSVRPLEFKYARQGSPLDLSPSAASYVFDGMRGLLTGDAFPSTLLLQGTAVAMLELLLAGSTAECTGAPCTQDAWRATARKALLDPRGVAPRLSTHVIPLSQHMRHIMVMSEWHHTITKRCLYGCANEVM